MEFSIQLNSEGVWVPITLAIRGGKTNWLDGIIIGYRENEDDVDDVVIREYHVEPDLVQCQREYFLYYSVQVCDFAFPLNSTQFRWLQTSKISETSKVKDAWTLDNVHISFYDGNVSVDLLQDSFNDPELK